MPPCYRNTFFLKHEIDTGDVLLSEKVAIAPDDTAGNLHDTLMQVGADLLVKTVKAIEAGTYTEHPQDHLSAGMELKHAPKIFKEDCLINWKQPVEQVYNHLRGLSPYPTAYTQFLDKTMKVFKAKPEMIEPTDTPGTFTSDHKTYLKVACLNGYLHLTDVQLEGKKRMGIEEFLRGVRF